MDDAGKRLKIWVAGYTDRTARLLQQLASRHVDHWMTTISAREANLREDLSQFVEKGGTAALLTPELASAPLIRVLSEFEHLKRLRVRVLLIGDEPLPPELARFSTVRIPSLDQIDLLLKELQADPGSEQQPYVTGVEIGQLRCLRDTQARPAC
jgi:hypothetical protein